MQLRNDFMKLTFYENLNARKCHCMCLGKDTGNGIFLFKGFVMNNGKEQRVVGVTVDKKLIIKNHIKNLCKKASENIGALSILPNHLNDSQKRLVLNSVVKYQFS